MGVRAVLWMQGETDTKAYRDATSGTIEEKATWSNRPLRNGANGEIDAPFAEDKIEKRWVRDAGDYRNKLAEVIRKTREFCNKPNLNWVVAQTSYIYDYTANRNYHSSPVIRDGQNASILERASRISY